MSILTKCFYHFILVFIVATIPVFSSLEAQCTVNGLGGLSFPSSPIEAGQRKGQTFTACETGEITKIELNLSAATANTEVELRISESPAIPTGILGSAVYETVVITTTSAQTLTIDLATPFPVTIGTSYAWELATVSGSYSCNVGGNDYPLGTTYAFTNGVLDIPPFDFDLDFSVEISPTAAPIPTISQWALFLLGLSLTTLALVMIKKRNIAAT